MNEFSNDFEDSQILKIKIIGECRILTLRSGPNSIGRSAKVLRTSNAVYKGSYLKQIFIDSAIEPKFKSVRNCSYFISANKRRGVVPKVWAVLSSKYLADNENPEKCNHCWRRLWFLNMVIFYRRPQWVWLGSKKWTYSILIKNSTYDCKRTNRNPLGNSYTVILVDLSINHESITNPHEVYSDLRAQSTALHRKLTSARCDQYDDMSTRLNGWVTQLMCVCVQTCYPIWGHNISSNKKKMFV